MPQILSNLLGKVRSHNDKPPTSESKGKSSNRPRSIASNYVPDRPVLEHLAQKDPLLLPEDPSDTSSAEGQTTGHISQPTQQPIEEAKSTEEVQDRGNPDATRSVSSAPVLLGSFQAATGTTAEGQKYLLTEEPNEFDDSTLPTPDLSPESPKKQANPIEHDEPDSRPNVGESGSITPNGILVPSSEQMMDRPNGHPPSVDGPAVSMRKGQPDNARPDGFEGGVYRHPETGSEYEVDKDHRTKSTLHPHERNKEKDNDKNKDKDKDEGSDVESDSGSDFGRTETMSSLSVFSNFPTASPKRNAEFHSLFPEAPSDEYLIGDFGCAAIHDMLHHGRLYLAESNLYFHSSLFGWITSFIIPFSEITSIEKRMTALIIPNGIQVTTSKEKYLFASFLSRDHTYDKIVKIWKLCNPTLEDDGEPDLKGEENQGKRITHRLANRIRLRRRIMRRNREIAKKKSKDVSESDYENEDEEHSQENKNKNLKSDTTKSSGRKKKHGSDKDSDHPKTECHHDEKDGHYPNIVMDETYATSLETMYNLLFTTNFTRDFLVEDQKLEDVEISDWNKSEDTDDQLRRNVTYIKPLNGSVGPKQTKCEIDEVVTDSNFDEFTSTVTTTRTPDVPSGNSFAVKTRTCLTWAGGRRTRVEITCSVEWSGRSFLKSVIDKASVDGQKEYYQSLNTNIRKFMKEHAYEFGVRGDEDDDEESEMEERQNTTEANQDNATIGPSILGLDLGQVYQNFIEPGVSTVSDALGTVAEQVQTLSPLTLAVIALAFFGLLSHMMFNHNHHSPTHAPSSFMGNTHLTSDHRTVEHTVKQVLEQLGHPAQAAHGDSPYTHAGSSHSYFSPPAIPYSDPQLQHAASISEIHRLTAWIEFQEKQLQSVRSDLVRLRGLYKAFAEQRKHCSNHLP